MELASFRYIIHFVIPSNLLLFLTRSLSSGLLSHLVDLHAVYLKRHHLLGPHLVPMALYMKVATVIIPSSSQG